MEKTLNGDASDIFPAALDRFSLSVTLSRRRRPCNRTVASDSHSHIGEDGEQQCSTILEIAIVHPPPPAVESARWGTRDGPGMRTVGALFRRDKRDWA